MPVGENAPPGGRSSCRQVSKEGHLPSSGGKSPVTLIVNYSEALREVPQGVAVYTANPTTKLLAALYFHRARS